MRRYSPHKVLTVTFQRSLSPEELAQTNLPGEVIEVDESHVRVRVPRDAVSASAQALLTQFPVADISIEESEVGDVIEQIFREGNLSKQSQ